MSANSVRKDEVYDSRSSSIGCSSHSLNFPKSSGDTSGAVIVPSRAGSKGVVSRCSGKLSACLLGPGRSCNVSELRPSKKAFQSGSVGTKVGVEVGRDVVEVLEEKGASVGSREVEPEVESGCPGRIHRQPPS